VKIFCEYQTPFGITRGAESPALAGEGNKLRVFAVFAVGSGAAVNEDAAV